MITWAYVWYLARIQSDDVSAIMFTGFVDMVIIGGIATAVYKTFELGYKCG